MCVSARQELESNYSSYRENTVSVMFLVLQYFFFHRLTAFTERYLSWTFKVSFLTTYSTLTFIILC